MTETLRLDGRKTPFPWFGGKADAAETVWALLGDCAHYVEPFFGGGAVLLRRPHPANRTYYSETVNDADGLLINFWRAVQHDPDAVAEYASWPVSEADKTARSCWVLAQDRELDLEHLMGDPDWHDAKLAGWWVWGVCVSIGAFGAGGPWWPDADGRIRKWGRDEPRPGVGVSREVPHLGNNGKGVNHPALLEPGVGEIPDFHPMTMPQLTAWIRFLSARLRHVRIINGDWRRAVGTGAALTLPVLQGKTPAAVFLDPPYSDDTGVYRDSKADLTVADAVAEWAVNTGDDPRWRIVVAGYDGDSTHDTYLDAGWHAIDWHTDGFLTGGYGSQSHKERLYASPHCITTKEQGDLW